jgi:hypothetical protein
LGRSARRLQLVYEDLDRFHSVPRRWRDRPADRDETADLLGSEGPIEST